MTAPVVVPPFSVHRQDRSGRSVLVVVGEVDMASVGELEASLTAAVDDGAHEIALDLSGVTFLDSLGIGAIVQSAVRQSRRRRRLVLVAPSERVRTVLELTGLLTVFSIEEPRLA